MPGHHTPHVSSAAEKTRTAVIPGADASVALVHWLCPVGAGHLGARRGESASRVLFFRTF